MEHVKIIYLFIIAIYFLMTIGHFNEIPVTPNDIADCTTYNMFGCVVMWVIMVIFNPVFYIAHFIYWIFHVKPK